MKIINNRIPKTTKLPIPLYKKMEKEAKKQNKSFHALTLSQLTEANK
mgnify:CR=1 FL=1